jgi:hypothetical protein
MPSIRPGAIEHGHARSQGGGNADADRGGEPSGAAVGAGGERLVRGVAADIRARRSKPSVRPRKTFMPQIRSVLLKDTFRIKHLWQEIRGEEDGKQLRVIGFCCVCFRRGGLVRQQFLLDLERWTM